MLTPKQVAALLGLSERTLAQWRWEQRGPAFHKVGAAVRYRQEDIEKWLAAGRRLGGESKEAA